MTKIHYALGAAALLIVMYAALCAPPLGQSEAWVHVPVGSSVGGVAAELQSARVVSSAFMFKVAVTLLGGSVQAGTYAPDHDGVLVLAYRMTRGMTGLDASRVTIPEGTTVREISDLLGVALPVAEEGYLFPDTYEFLPGTPAEQIVARMRARYEEQVGPLRAEIAASGHSEEEIIIMASLLQKEARLPETMAQVSGILWKRIEIGMALQVDAVFGYINNRPTYHPTGADLDIDSPYNTYRNRGLPPGPIGNPGLDAITAALRPTESPYLYYLTGKDGTMHYAKTFDEHVANKRFLR